MVGKVTAQQIKNAMLAQTEQAKQAQQRPQVTPQEVAINAVFNNQVSVIRLSVQVVRPFEGNPRTVDNEEANAIKESIRSSGLNQKLTVTRRPGQDFYILASGGRTRLHALQELASEDSARFEQQDFLLEPYESEEKLLAAHMIENHVRSKNMVLWDTAQGFMKLLEEHTRQIKYEPSASEFVKHLNELGLVANERQIQRYQFVCEHFAGLDEGCRAQLGTNAIRDLLQPSVNVLKTIWNKHPDHSDSTFKEAYLQAVALYLPPADEAQPVSPADTDEAANRFKFNPADLQRHINQHFAQLLGYELAHFEQMLDVVKADKKGLITLDELIQPPPPLPTKDEDSNSPGAAANQIPAPTGELSEQDRIAAEGLERLRQRLSQGGGSSLKVAQTHELTPTRPGGQDFDGEANANSNAHLGGTTQDLVGLTEEEAAREEFRSLVMELATEAGINKYVVWDVLTPYQFYVEVPPSDQTIGNNADDVAVQCWWFLNSIANIFSELDLNPDCLNEQSRLRMAYCAYAQGEDETLWREVVANQLGGAVQTDAAFALDVMTGEFQLRTPAFRLIQSLFLINTYAIDRLHAEGRSS